jgi:hypothetical protein
MNQETKKRISEVLNGRDIYVCPRLTAMHQYYQCLYLAAIGKFVGEAEKLTAGISLC